MHVFGKQGAHVSSTSKGGAHVQVRTSPQWASALCTCSTFALRTFKAPFKAAGCPKIALTRGASPTDSECGFVARPKGKASNTASGSSGATEMPLWSRASRTLSGAPSSSKSVALPGATGSCTSACMYSCVSGLAVMHARQGEWKKMK